MRSSKLRLAPIIGLSLMAVLLVPGSVAAASPLSMYVPRIAGNCVYIEAPANKTLTLTWKDSASMLKESASIPTGAYGDPRYCSASHVIEVGDRLKVVLGSNSHKLTIPNLTARINRVTDVIRGTGPAGARVSVECGHSPFGQFEPCQWHKTVTVNSAGNWSAQIPFDVFGGWEMNAAWFNAYGDLVYREVTTPYVQVFLDKARFSGVTRPLSSATVDLADEALVDKGSGTGDSGPLVGSFIGEFRNTDGDLVTVEPGDHVSSSVATDASFVVPEISATATAANDRVAGECGYTGEFHGVVVELYRNGHMRGFTLDGYTDGTFDFDFKDAFPSDTDIRAGDKLFIKCITNDGFDYAVKVIFAT
jgi:hypothetical protein